MLWERTPKIVVCCGRRLQKLWCVLGEDSKNCGVFWERTPKIVVCCGRGLQKLWCVVGDVSKNCGVLWDRTPKIVVCCGKRLQKLWCVLGEDSKNCGVLWERTPKIVVCCGRGIQKLWCVVGNDSKNCGVFWERTPKIVVCCGRGLQKLWCVVGEDSKNCGVLWERTPKIVVCCGRRLQKLIKFDMSELVYKLLIYLIRWSAMYFLLPNVYKKRTQAIYIVNSRNIKHRSLSFHDGRLFWSMMRWNVLWWHKNVRFAQFQIVIFTFCYTVNHLRNGILIFISFYWFPHPNSYKNYLSLIVPL